MNYLQNKFLEYKITYTSLFSRSSLHIWSLIEQITKDIFEFVGEFITIDIKKWDKKLLKKLKEIQINKKRTHISSLDFIGIFNIYSNKKINKHYEKELKSLYFERNDMAHVMKKSSRIDEFIFFKLINELIDNIYSKI